MAFYIGPYMNSLWMIAESSILPVVFMEGIWFFALYYGNLMYCCEEKSEMLLSRLMRDTERHQRRCSPATAHSEQKSSTLFPQLEKEYFQFA